MSQFAVLHITKYKALGRIGNHIDRKHITSNVDRDKIGFNQELTHTLGKTIDTSKSHLREEFSPFAQQTLEQAVGNGIQKGYTQKRAIRKDAVKALGVILTGSHERMKEIEEEPQRFEAWKQANLSFACQEFGQENIVRFTLRDRCKTN